MIIKIRRAKVGDVQQIVSLINSYAEKGEMLYRSQSQVLQQVRNYFVAAQTKREISPPRTSTRSSGQRELVC